MESAVLLLYMGWGVALVAAVCLLLVCIVACSRERRSDRELKRNMQEVEVVRTEFQRAQQSLEDFEEEKQLLLSRLKGGGFECPAVMRRCLQELQIHLAAAELSNLSLKNALKHKPQIHTNPPALLAELWLVHGDLYPDRTGTAYPDLGKRQTLSNKP